jgi:FlaA1/EpsC-like NDP-sugar epimerase
MFDNKKILITGGTGSWGTTLVRLLLEKYNPREIIIFSRSELKHVIMARSFNDTRIKFIIGDIRDREAITRAMRGVDIVYHLAAMKHLPVCEVNPLEAVKTNIDGTANIIEACIANNVEYCIDVSTDKAAEPSNLYGMTKAVGEKLIIQANDISDTKFICVRGGNVLGSSGSVVPFFIEQIKNGGPITITDVNMTRFFLTLEEAILLLFEATVNSIGGETFVMRMPACNILNLAEVIMDHYGKVDTIITGIRPGEKLDEVLVTKHEALLTRCWGEHYFVILPPAMNDKLLNKYGDLPNIQYTEFDSKTETMSNELIKDRLIRGGFLV